MARLPIRSILLGATLATGMFTSATAAGIKTSKFLGNTSYGDAIRTDFTTYWNQITPEVAGSWPAVEGTRGTFTWTHLDAFANFANTHQIPWNLDPLLGGGASFGSWFGSLSQADQMAEATKWFDSAAAHYPDVPLITVVSEGYPTHSSSLVRAALGGGGTTGVDWIITAFKMARARWPKATLINNDYNTIEYATENAWMLALVKTLLENHTPIDGIGCEAHDAYKLPTPKVKAYMDSLAATGLPLYITQYDIAQSNDSLQLKVMVEQFPMFWNHPRVAGITYWGYVSGQTWRSGSGLISSAGVERPALTWLREYVAANPNPPVPTPATGVRTVGASRVAPRRTGMIVREIDGHLTLGLEREGRFVPVGVLGRH